MSSVSSLQRRSSTELFPGKGRTLGNNDEDILHPTSQNPRTVTHNQFENAKGTKIVGSLTIAGDIGIENDPAAYAPIETHDQFKGASDVHISGSLAIAKNIPASGSNDLASILATLQGEKTKFYLNVHISSLF